MMYSVIVSILLAVAYIAAAIWRKKQLPESISALVYELPRNWQWVWIVWMWVVSFTACIPLIDVLGEGLDVLGFITIAALVWCGGMPIYQKDMILPHYTSAIIAGLFSQACVLFICPWWWLAWIPLVWLTGSAFAAMNECDGVPKVFDGKGVFLAEVTCAVSTYGAILTALLT